MAYASCLCGIRLYCPEPPEPTRCASCDLAVREYAGEVTFDYDLEPSGALRQRAVRS